MDTRSGTPQWWRHGVVYQIYPRSFMDGDGDGVGDLAGAITRLPYLKALGVDAVWFTPWYLSPQADGGYDVADYRQIDPRFGTLADAEDFIRQAAALGIRTIIDIVPNHVSVRHPWFQEALASEPGSPARARFWFHDGRGVAGEQMPTNWLSSFRGHTWTRTTDPDGRPGQWYLHLFTPEQPDLNWNNPEVRAEHEAILRFWFDRGVAGVRVDSAALIIKDPALPDVAEGEAGPGRHPFIDRDEIHQVYRSWRRIAESYDPPRVLVGEVWLDDPARFAAYLGDQEMNTAFNFDFMAQPWRADRLRASIETTLAAHASSGAPATWVLSNHDVTRPVTRYGRADSSFAFERKRFGVPTDLALGERRARAAFLLVAALPGSLYIYQGDELGLPEDEELPIEAIEDPMYFRSGGVDPGRDGCRVPLPWTASDEHNFGFSAPVSRGDRSGASVEPGTLQSATGPSGSGRSVPDSGDPGQSASGPGGPGDSGQSAPSWLPQPAWWGTYSALGEEADPDSMLVFYRRVLAWRRHLEDLAGPAFAWLEEPPAGCLGFRRGEVVCLVNFGPGPALLPPGQILVASGPVLDGAIGADTAVWLGRPGGDGARTNDPAAPQAADSSSQGRGA